MIYQSGPSSKPALDAPGRVQRQISTRRVFQEESKKEFEPTGIREIITQAVSNLGSHAKIVSMAMNRGFLDGQGKRNSKSVAHFDSSEGIKRHHSSCEAVRHDHLPDERAIRSMLESDDLAIEVFIEEPGFYCIIGKKSGLKAGRPCTEETGKA